MIDSLPYEIWISRSSGLLSILGSSTIIYIILSASQEKLAKSKNRFMLMMSIFDILQSTAMAMGTAAVPKDTGVYGAIGNTTTCTIQSILLSLGLAVPCYNASLNLFYLLLITYKMTEARFATNIEAFLHAFSVLGPLSATITFASLGYSRPLTGACMMPEKVPIYMFSTVISLCFIFGMCSMGSICWSVIRQARRMKRYRFSSSRTNSASMLEHKEIVKQALLYSLAFFLTYVFIVIDVLKKKTNAENKVAVWSILRAVFYPLQGFFNFIFYIRPGIIQARKIDPSISLIGAMKQVIFKAESISGSTTSRRSVPQASNTGIRGLNSEQQVKNEISFLDSPKGDNTSQPDGNDGREKAVSETEVTTESVILGDTKQCLSSNNDDGLKIDTAVNINSASDEESDLYNKATPRRLSLVTLSKSLNNLEKDVASVDNE